MMHSGHLEEAITYFKHAIESNIDVEQYHLSYNTALKLIDENLQPTNELEKLYALYGKQKYNDAFVLANKFISSFPVNGEGWKIFGAILYSLEKFSESFSAFSTAIKYLPDDSELYFNLAILYKLQGNFIDASTFFSKVIILNPDRLDTYCALGNLLKEQEEFIDAEELYRKAISLKDDYAEAYNNLGVLLNETNRKNEAEEAYRKAISCKPNYPSAYRNLAVCLYTQKKLQSAREFYQKAIILNPDDMLAHRGLGMLLKDLGKMKEAEVSYNKSIALMPSYAEAHSNLGQLFCLSDKILEALKAYNECFELSKTDIGLDAGVYLSVLYYLNYDLNKSYSFIQATKEIINSTAKEYKNSRSYWYYLYRLLEWHHDNFKHDKLSKDYEILYVVGDSHSLSAHTMIVQYKKKRMISKAKWIVGCKQWHLGNKVYNQYKYNFETIMSNLPKGATVLLTIGEIDCRHDEGILKIFNKLNDKSLEDYIYITINSYISYILKINENYGHRIIISGVPAMNNIEIDYLSDELIKQRSILLNIFNGVSKQVAFEAGFDFLDVYNLTNNGNGIANKDLYLDSHHLLPSSFVKAFEECCILSTER